MSCRRLQSYCHATVLHPIAISSRFFSQFLQLLLLTLIITLNSTAGKQLLSNEKRESLEKAKLSPKQLLMVEKLHYTWYLMATNALLGAVAREMYSQMDRSNRRAFIRCLRHIKKDIDIEAGAKCITAALDNRLLQKFPDISNQVTEPVWNNYKHSDEDSKSFVQQDVKTDSSYMNLGINAFRKPSIRIKPMNSWRRLKRQITPINWNNKALVKRHATFRIDGQVKEMMDESKRLAKEEQNSEIKIIRMEQAPNLIDPKEEFMSMAKSPIWTTSKMLTNFFRAFSSKTPSEQKPWKEAYKKLEEIQEKIEDVGENAKYRNRMLDFVLQNNNRYRERRTLTERVQGYLPDGMQKSPLVKKLLKLLDSFAKHNGDANFKILSPRFLPVVPEKKKIRNALSPSLFSMYNDESPNSILPIPKMLKATGMSDADRDAILELILQTTGARKLVDETIESIDRVQKFGLAEDVTNITAFIRDLFTKLEKSFNSRQKREIESRKYTFMTKQQLLALFGPQGPYNSTEFPFSIEEYGTWTEEDKQTALFNQIRVLAGESEAANGASHNRRKRQVTLSPFAFSPSILGVSVLAPITLSPSIFSPGILYPSILSPPVLSPQIANPLIISPYILGPNVMSAAVMNVYVLTPYVLSPNVLNPYVMSPLILSPFILSPDLLSPTVLSGSIISPSVLSPSVLSPSVFAADILSPSIMS